MKLWRLRHPKSFRFTSWRTRKANGVSSSLSLSLSLEAGKANVAVQRQSGRKAFFAVHRKVRRLFLLFKLPLIGRGPPA